MDYIIKNLSEETGNNSIIANNITFTDSYVLFRGENNILYIEEGAVVSNCDIIFYGSNSLVYIGKTRYNCTFKVNIYNNSVFHIGKNNSVNGKKPIFQLSEQKNIFLGNDNMMSYGISVRIADPHLIYNVETNQRINPSRSVYIGDHVWIGQNVSILKGVKVGSGSILAGEAVVTKNVVSNVTVGGNPAKLLKSGIFWLRPSVHAFVDEDTKKWNEYDKNSFIYEDENIKLFDKIEENFNLLQTSEEKLEFILNMSSYKNRFYL